ncbi:uncharacterized protein PSANT_06866 [Moesziomyces antarcticus]|uniref:Serine hydrolase domain-containing protein n=1 Tax=Pseudozyma antarctica TaxID=84753 RepID=A0A5C3FZ74_PSEA2|nr:uncharacterized protein PSANT_06866 [Moesziomyces antarcticus]
MKTQIKPIVDALGELVEVEYLEGGERCAPHQGIESIFPGQAYFSWYEQPTRAALQAAHIRVAAKLDASGCCYRKQSDGSQQLRAAIALENEISIDPLAMHPALTDTASTGALPALTPSYGGTDSDASTAGPTTPLEEHRCAFDGVICFSQGCAVSTGMLLELRAHVGAGLDELPVRLVILICGGRPFESGGGLQRVDTRGVAPLEIKSVHVHGRHDTNLAESRQLASLYDDRDKQVIELDIGHCPPRRTSEVSVVAAAIRSALVTLD